MKELNVQMSVDPTGTGERPVRDCFKDGNVNHPSEMSSAGQQLQAFQ